MSQNHKRLNKKNVGENTLSCVQSRKLPLRKVRGKQGNSKAITRFC